MSGVNKSFLGASADLVRHNGLLILFFFAAQLTLFTDIHVYVKDAFSVVAIVLLWRKNWNRIYGRALILFSISYFFLFYLKGQSESNFESLSYLVCPIAYFLMGYSVVDKAKSEQEIVWFLLLTMLLSSVFLWMNNIADVSFNGFINTSRELYNINISATLQGLIAAIGISAIAYSVSYGTKNILEFIVSLTITSLSVFCVLHLVNRSGLFVLLFTVAASMFYRMRSNKGFVIITSIIVFILYYIIVNSGALYMDVFDAYSQRNEGVSSIESGSGRFERWIDSITYIFQYPFGWIQNRSIGYSHNLWLDVARATGIIPFVLICAASVKNYKVTYWLYKYKGFALNGFLVGINVCLFFSAFVEPVMGAVSTIFYLMCMIWGVQLAQKEKLEYEFKDNLAL